MTVHPHACGEHSRSSRLALPSIGSSPRMWGTLSLCLSRSSQNRFIPTHVGNTCFLPLDLIALTVHPHACGEHTLATCNVLPRLGSSPRMWGTHLSTAQRDCPQRFIPTHVGNTLCIFYCSPLDAVHPHACGEHIYIEAIREDMAGSSPRMWGTQMFST